MEKYLGYINGRIICRDNVVKQHYSLIGYSDEPMPYSIFIYGHVATGKSLVVDSMLSYVKYNITVINCIEHVNDKYIFNYILNDLSSNFSNLANSEKQQHKCDSIAHFGKSLKEISIHDTRPIVIVLDKCEKLRDVNTSLLPAFSRLKELSNFNVCVIFISGIVWEKLLLKIGVYEPLKFISPNIQKMSLLKYCFLACHTITRIHSIETI